MDLAEIFASSVANTQLALLREIIVDERKAVADASARFEAALVKSDNLRDDGASLAARIVKDKTSVKEALLNGARARLFNARDSLAIFSVAFLGSSPRAIVGHAIPKMNEDEVEEIREKKNNKLLKRKLPSPKDGWLDKKGIVLHSCRDRHHLLHHLSYMF
jgi:hypothetical protein